MEHVGWDLHKLNIIFHDFFHSRRHFRGAGTAELIMSEHAANG